MSDFPLPASAHSRLDAATAQNLTVGKRSVLPPLTDDRHLGLPIAEFPRRPELLKAPDQPYFPDGRRKWKANEIFRAMRGWMFPFFWSRVLPGEFHPLIAYLFNEWKCNLQCQYCWAYDNRVQGMSEEVARRSIDWLHTTTCRVLALMGGEVLLRPQFTHRIVDYAASKGFWVYLPTNGRLLRPDVVDRMADAGVATFNLAVDAWNIKPGLPKAMVPIRENFEYLIRKQYKYGYTVFLNINICRNNLEDVCMLTELAHDNGIATDYHICETPMMEQENFNQLEDNPVFIRGEDHAAIPTYSATYDWGTVEQPKMDNSQLKVMKQGCESNCFSTLNHILAFCYNDARVIRWLLKQAANGFQGVRGNME